jgi:hypothetical protein
MTSKTFDGSSNTGADSSGECGARISNF